ncbi:MAG: phosphotransferase family protein [Maricaulaceae bacterium]
MSSNNPTVPVRDGEELNISAVDVLIKAKRPDIKSMPKVTQYSSGASNLTYAVDYEEQRYVLRRPPFGYIPKGGHDMNREYRIQTALQPAYPYVPKTLLYTDDDSHIGAEFYLMERTEGHLIHTDIPLEWGWGASEASKLNETFVQRLIDLHKVDYKAIGLGDFGKPDGYVDRQVFGWNKRFTKAWTEDIEKFEDVCQWLEDNRPDGEQGVGLLHGDFRIDNCILDLDDPTQIKAILDWEISALGDPLMDLGNTLSYWIQADDPDFMKLMIRQPCAAPGMMTRQEFLDFYTAQIPLDQSKFQFYYVYGIWRLAVIVQQIYFRYYHKQTDNPKFKSYGMMSDALGKLARLKINSGKL